MAPESITHIETLPNELLYRIATFIPANSMTVRGCSMPDRFQLAIVNKRISEACTPLLYEYVFLDSYKQLFKFHQSAGVVRESWRTVSLIFAYNALFKHPKEPKGTTWPRLLFPLTQMRNLREFVIDRNKEYVHEFSHKHPALNYLISHASNPNFLPCLSVLEVSHNPGLLSLCRGRPVTSVILGPSLDTTSSQSFDKFLLELGKTTEDLNELSLVVTMDSENPNRNVDNRVRQIVALCPQLQAVSLRLPNGFLGTRAPDTFQSSFTKWMRSILAPWTQLTHLSIRVDTTTNVTIRIEEELVKSLVQTLPSLKYIKMPVSRGEWIRATSCDGIPEWTPRPDLGTQVLDWWFDRLIIHIETHTKSDPPAKISWDQAHEQIIKTQAVMKKWWSNAVVPSQGSMYAYLLERG